MYELSGEVEFESEKNLELTLIEWNDQGDQDSRIKGDIVEEKEWLIKHQT